MSFKHTAFAFLGSLLSICFAGRADAITLPDSGTCTSTGGTPCLAITNTATEGIAFEAAASGTGASTGIAASGPYAGVLAYSTSGKALWGIATDTNGIAVLGSTNATNGIGVEGASTTNAIGVEGSSSSNVGVYGISSSNYGVYGQSTSGNGVWGRSDSPTNAAVVGIATSNASTALGLYGQGGIEITGSFAQKAGGGMWTAPSDRRIKKDVKAFNDGLANLMRVRPVLFKYNGLGGTSDDGREYVGVIAQDLEKIMPAMVSSRAVKLRPTDAKETDIKKVDPSEFTYLLINAVQEQQKIIQKQEERIAKLERTASPVAASLLSSGGPATAATLGLLPVGLIVAIRRRRKVK